MELIKGLVPYINHKHFASELRNSKQLFRLFEIVITGNKLSDKEIFVKMFGANGSKDAFKQIRLRLRERLLEHIARHGIEYKNMDSYAVGFRKCLNQLNAAKVLNARGARSTSVILAEELIKTTTQFEYTELTLILARDLDYYYNTINYDRIKSLKYRKVWQETEQLYMRELEAARCYSEIRGLFITSHGSIKEKALKKSVIYAEKLKPWTEEANKSYQLVANIYHVMAMRFEIAADYIGLLEVCDNAIEVLSKCKVKRIYGCLHFDLYKIVALIQLREYTRAEEIAEQYFEKMSPGLFNWVVLKIYMLIANLHSGKYQKAFQITKEVTADYRLMNLSMSLLQTWTVYEAHIEFLVAIGKVKTDQPSKFRLNKFLNEIPLYTKDKKGLNIAILIIHVLFLLQQRKYSQIIDRVDALKLYCYRYLRKDETFRSHCFIRMLLQMPRADFMRLRTERYAEPFLSKLRSVPLTVSEQTIEVEVIPYEDLWEMTLELLD